LAHIPHNIQTFNYWWDINNAFLTGDLFVGKTAWVLHPPKKFKIYITAKCLKFLLNLIEQKIKKQNIILTMVMQCCQRSAFFCHLFLHWVFISKYYHIYTVNIYYDTLCYTVFTVHPTYDCIRVLSIKPKKTDFLIKKPIQSIFLLTKNRKTEKKSGKYLKLAEADDTREKKVDFWRIAVAYKQFLYSYSVPWLISDVCKRENKTEIFVICNRNGRHIFIRKFSLKNIGFFSVFQTVFGFYPEPSDPRLYVIWNHNYAN
jgi:hypothetical protein